MEQIKNRNEGIKKYYKQIQPVKELLCWILNFDSKVLPCFIYFVKKQNDDKIFTLINRYSYINLLIEQKMIDIKLDVLLSLKTDINDSNPKCNLSKLSEIVEDQELFRIVTSRGLSIKMIDDKKKSFIIVNDNIKELLRLTNQKLLLLIEIVNKIPFNLDVCSRIGQTSTGQILLILKELVNNGMENELNEQREIATKINSLIELESSKESKRGFIETLVCPYVKCCSDNGKKKYVDKKKKSKRRGLLLCPVKPCSYKSKDKKYKKKKSKSRNVRKRR